MQQSSRLLTLVSRLGLARRPISLPARTTSLQRLEQRIARATFSVTTTAASGAGSFRQAILDANATTAADLIEFHLGGAANALQIVHPLTPLPIIVAPVTIDGFTQGDASPNTSSAGNNAVLRVVLDGSDLTLPGHGLVLGGTGGSTVQGLVISGFVADDGFSAAGILVTSGNNVIAGNYFGLPATRPSA